MKKILISFLLAVTLVFSGCSLSEGYKVSEMQSPVTTNLEVHYIDVGQANCSLIMNDGETMLIDGGNADDSRLVVSYLKNQGISRLDYVVCTHAHEDHVGGLSGPLSVFDVGAVYAPETENDIKAYNNFKKAALKNAGEIKNPKIGETVEIGESVFTFLGPVKEDSDNLNNTSLVLRGVFGKTSFLFTGDTERENEIDIIDTGTNLRSTVLMAGHHGSSTSNSYVFLREVMPEYAVISVGKGNDYGHPHDEVLSRFENLGAKVYRTDKDGTVIAYSDGENVTFSSGRNEEKTAENIYVGNKNSKKFHRADCASLPSEKNSVYFNTKDEAIEKGYSPCGGCRP